MLTDAGPLVALHDRREPDHLACRSIVSGNTGPLLATWPVFAEAMYLIERRRGWMGQQGLLQLVLSGGVNLFEPANQLLVRMHALMAKYADLPMDLADASLVAVAEDQGLDTIFTLDTDFDVYRLHGKKKIKRVP